MSSEKKDYLFILKALDEIPFSVGKNLLLDFLCGDEKNVSIKRNKLHNCSSFGTLAYTKEELFPLIDSLILNGLIVLSSVQGKSYWKVLELTEKGKSEIENPSLYKNKLANNAPVHETVISDAEKTLFNALPYLNKYDDAQKKAIICNNEKILCVAGAGSGKTTVLTQRIDFLVRFRSVEPKKILAITFTKKAKAELLSRISNESVVVETFNSFCEKLLRRHNNLCYDKPVQVISYREKILLLRKALSHLNVSMSRAICTYFTPSQRRTKTDEVLSTIFMHDVFFLRDYLKAKNMVLNEEDITVSSEHQESFELVMQLSKYIEEQMTQQGLRDFTDQLVDALNLLKEHPEIIPQFDHILVDEYQDVNASQIELLDILNAANLFCVGDPRQSIFGWRGSDIKYIVSFSEKYPGADIVMLTKNYRSTKHVVDLANTSIRSLGLPDMQAHNEGEKDVSLMKCSSEQEEFSFIAKKILESTIQKKEIFVLARTNRQLNELSQFFRKKKIRHVVRSDEVRRSVKSSEGDVTLATIHAIKGMEAELVFVIGCTSRNFPCKASDHPVIDLVKIDTYDKEEEERRLFYVALSRAKNSLVLTHTGAHTYFITSDMKNSFEGSTKKTLPNDPTFTRLQEWRTKICSDLGLPAYCIMHNKTLIDIASQKPQTIEELQAIPGVGPTKVMNYGHELLDIINGL